MAAGPYAKQNQGNLTFSSDGVGNPQQLTGELFNKLARRADEARALQGRRAAARRGGPGARLADMAALEPTRMARIANDLRRHNAVVIWTEG